jgi:hypothetical protein
VATTKQKEAARRNLVKARAAQSARAEAKEVKRAPALSTAAENRMSSTEFAFPEQRKEPLVDAEHVRNAIARFDQVEDVSDADRDRAWRRIKAAAKKYDVEVSAKDWRELFVGGRAHEH